MAQPRHGAAPDVEHVALWGDEHPELGQQEVLALGPATAIAISAGRLPKPYAHLDPNEDAALAASGPAGTLLAVADGHSGFDAARAAIAGVAGRLDLLWDPGGVDPQDLARDLLAAALRRVRDALADAPGDRRRSRTALSIGLLVGGDLAVGGWGDTQVLRIRGLRAKPVGMDGPFLDASSDVPDPVRVRLKDGDVVLACSDGLRDYLREDWAHRAAGVVASSEDAASGARRLVEAAWDGGAGDHISVAVSQAALR